jgi:hypothetical protein
MDRFDDANLDGSLAFRPPAAAPLVGTDAAKRKRQLLRTRFRHLAEFP